MRSAEAFKALARNRIPDERGRPISRYIDRGGPERHYDLHLDVIAAAFGVGARFEDNAAVTGLLLCASVSSPPVDLVTTSPCAKTFLARTVDQVRPEVIVGVGAAVDTYFRSRATSRGDLAFRAVIGGHHAWFVPVPHPNARGLSSETRRFATRTTGPTCRGQLACSGSKRVEWWAPEFRTLIVPPSMCASRLAGTAKCGVSAVEMTSRSRCPGRSVQSVGKISISYLRGRPAGTASSDAVVKGW
jgi:hypothetical protein